MTNRRIRSGVLAIVTTAVTAFAAAVAAPAVAQPSHVEKQSATPTLRVATYNLSLNRGTAGELVADLSTPDDVQAQTVAEVIQRTNPDIVLLNEFDYVPDEVAVDLFRDNYLSVSQHGAAPVDYPYAFVAPSNTGVPSGFDLNNDGIVGGGDDALGFGLFEGQFGMAVLSKYPIAEGQVRTFQNFLWKDMPGALLPDDLSTPEASDWFTPEELEVVRLSSKSHWDVPVQIGSTTLHILASHPTPPTFDSLEDRNGRRNHDEIRFWADYISPGQSEYIVDDEGQSGGLRAGELFVILGDQNADPVDGDSFDDAILQLLNHPRIADPRPTSAGAVEAATIQGGANLTHEGDPAFDTADFADGAPGNLRADYVLPSRARLHATDAGVFWPVTDDPLYRLTGKFPFPSSDHRLVWVDLRIPGSKG